MIERVVSWQGIDDPGRFDTAQVRLYEGHLDGAGSSRTPHHLLRWVLSTGPGWVTRSLVVDIAASRWSRRLELRRDDEGRWHCESDFHGKPVTAEGRPLQIEGSDWSPASDVGPGIVDARSLSGALDCDLGLCPVTNTMPMLRTVLAPGARANSPEMPGPEASFVMAWVEVPSLRVIRSDQIYQLRSMRPDGGAVVRYVGMHRSFVGDLDVDADGLVIDYPQLARRIPTVR